MNVKRMILLFTLSAFAFLSLTILAQNDTYRYANVTYKLPPGWKVDKGYEYVPYYLKKGVSAVRMTIQRPDYSRGQYLQEAAKRVSWIRSDPSVIRADGPREISLAKGVTGILASAVSFQGDNAGAYRGDLVAVIDLGDKFQVITVDSADTDAFDKAKDGAEQLISSMVFDSAGGSGPPPPAKITAEAVDKAPEDIPYPLSIPTTDMDAAADAAARAVRAGGKDALPALVFAAVQSGFTIRNSKGSIVKYPASGKGNGFGLTAIELLLYSDLEQSGFTADFGSVCRELGAHIGRIFGNTKLDFRSGLLHGLGAAANSTQKPVRFLARFLDGLGRNADQPYDLLPGNPPEDARLDAVQMLFIIRASVGQIASVLSLRAAEKPKLPDSGPLSGTTLDPSGRGPYVSGMIAELAGPALSAAGPQLSLPPGTPGYVEDAVVGSKTGMVGETINILEGIFDKEGLDSSGVSKVGQTLQYVNALNSIIKFAATYACLSAEFELSGGKKKNVLERTKNKTPGEEKTVQVKFVMDTNKLIQFYKDIRVFIANFGVDVDMPSAGPMAGLEVEWTMPKTNRRNLGENVAYLKGEKDAEAKSNFLRSVTDSEGRSKVGLVGEPQKEDMTRYSIVPVRKSALVQATIQVKRPEIKQDFVDAIAAAWGVFPVSGLTPRKTGGETVGPLAWLTPVMETFYRMKCLAPKSYRVPVIDWEYAGFLVSVSVQIRGSGQTAKPQQKGAFNWVVDRALTVEDIVMDGDKFPVLDPELVKLMDIKQPSFRAFQQLEPETAKITIKDFTYEDGESASCIDPKKKERFVKRANWTAPPEKPTLSQPAAIGGIRFALDPAEKRYVISLPGIGGGVAMTEMTYSDSHQSGGRAPSVSGPVQYISTLFFSLKPKEQFGFNSLGKTIVRALPPVGPDNKLPVIEDRQAFVDVMRVPFGPVSLNYSWRIEPVQGKSTVARNRKWNPWGNTDWAGPYTEAVEESSDEWIEDIATCYPVAFSVLSFPKSSAAPETNARSIMHASAPHQEMR